MNRILYARNLEFQYLSRRGKCGFSEQATVLPAQLKWRSCSAVPAQISFGRKSMIAFRARSLNGPATLFPAIVSRLSFKILLMSLPTFSSSQQTGIVRKSNSAGSFGQSESVAALGISLRKQIQ